MEGGRFIVEMYDDAEEFEEKYRSQSLVNDTPLGLFFYTAAKRKYLPKN